MSALALSLLISINVFAVSPTRSSKEYVCSSVKTFTIYQNLIDGKYQERVTRQTKSKSIYSAEIIVIGEREMRTIEGVFESDNGIHEKFVHFLDSTVTKLEENKIKRVSKNIYISSNNQDEGSRTEEYESIEIFKLEDDGTRVLLEQSIDGKDREVGYNRRFQIDEDTQIYVNYNDKPYEYGPENKQVRFVNKLSELT